jgi:hypothetical protein
MGWQGISTDRTVADVDRLHAKFDANAAQALPSG